MLGSRDVGHRVVVRRQAGVGGHGRILYTDLLGELIAVDGERLLVRADDGVEHTVALTEVTAAKRIPPRPVRYSEIAALERVADQAWPAPEHELLGDWLLRAAAGFTNRANSALPLGDAGRPTEAAIEACRRWYGARSLTARITVPLPLRRDVADMLASLGWQAQPTVLVQTADLAGVLAGTAPAGPVELLTAPSDGFLRIVTARKTGPPGAAYRVLCGGQVRFAETPGGEGPSAIARGSLVREWLHIGLVEVAETARRQGLARRVSRALASWARSEGATRALLQVEEHNTAAVALYGSMGFRTHHTYVTYRSPG